VSKLRIRGAISPPAYGMQKEISPLTAEVKGMKLARKRSRMEG